LNRLKDGSSGMISIIQEAKLKEDVKAAKEEDRTAA